MKSQEPTPQELCEEIDATRIALGQTVEELAAKTAIKARLERRAAHLKDVLERPVFVAAIPATGIALVIGWAVWRRNG